MAWFKKKPPRTGHWSEGLSEALEGLAMLAVIGIIAIAAVALVGVGAIIWAIGRYVFQAW